MAEEILKELGEELAEELVINAIEQATGVVIPGFPFGKINFNGKPDYVLNFKKGSSPSTTSGKSANIGKGAQSSGQTPNNQKPEKDKQSSKQDETSTKGTGKPIKTVDDLIDRAELDKDKGKSTIYRLKDTNGYEQALQDFEALNPTDVVPIVDKKTAEQIGYTGKINWNGEIYQANVRNKSSGKEPTIEIVISKHDRIKFRYD